MSLIILPMKNNLGKGSAPYCIHSRRSGDVDHAALVELVAQSLPMFSRHNIEACFAKYCELLGIHLADGKCVKTCIGSFYLCASGQLEYAEQAFDPRAEDSDHKLRVHYRPNRSFESSVTSRVRIERLSEAPFPHPELFSACASQDNRKSVAKAGEFIKVSGRRLEFDKSDSLLGLFFLNDREERSDLYAAIHPSSCTAQLPLHLAPGSYTLAVRTRSPSGELLEGRLEGLFTVET